MIAPNWKESDSPLTVGNNRSLDINPNHTHTKEREKVAIPLNDFLIFFLLLLKTISNH